MSMPNNKTAQLWKSFMIQRKKIINATGSNLLSIQIYNPLYFKHFNSKNLFTKWTTTEVTHFESIPYGLKTSILSSELYAIFLFKGDSNKIQELFQYIFGVWLPKSEYEIDNRPHIELLG